MAKIVAFDLIFSWFLFRGSSLVAKAGPASPTAPNRVHEECPMSYIPIISPMS
jgi:hypothetical protein